MGAKFLMGRAGPKSTYVPAVGEVILHVMPDGSQRTVVGDGKTPAFELPSLQPLDIYPRVDRLEQEVRDLRNGALCDPVRRELTVKERVALERTIAFIEGNGWICDTLRQLLEGKA